MAISSTVVSNPSNTPRGWTAGILGAAGAVFASLAAGEAADAIVQDEVLGRY